jgi:hypothetical protein
MLFLALYGFVIGLIVAAPHGPWGMFAVWQLLRGAWPLAVVAAVSSSLGDVLLAAIALHAVEAAQGWWMHAPWGITLVLAALIIGLGGWLLLVPAVRSRPQPARASSLWGVAATGFVWTLMNPGNLAAVGALYLGAGVYAWVVDFPTAAVLLLATLAGCLTAWALILAGMWWFRDRLPLARLEPLLQRLVGVFFVAAGVFMVARALWG